MSVKMRAGSPTVATLITVGTDNDATAPRLVNFGALYAKPCFVSTPIAFSAAVRIKINVPVTDDFSGAAMVTGPGYYTCAPGASVDVSLGGLIAVEQVTFITQNAADDLDLVSVVGWTP